MENRPKLPEINHNIFYTKNLKSNLNALTDKSR